MRIEMMPDNAQSCFDRFVSTWVLPPRFRSIAGGLVFRMIVRPSRRERPLLQRNRKWHEKYRGKQCFVIGSGKSLSGKDLSTLKSEPVIVTSSGGPCGPGEHIHCVFGAADESARQIVDLTDEIREAHCDAVFTPLETRKNSVVGKALSVDRVFFLRMRRQIVDWKPEDTLLDLSGTMPLVPDVSILGVMLALAMGCSPICLLGFDCDDLAQRIPPRFVFDGTQTRPSGSANPCTYLNVIKRMRGIWRAHERLLELARKRGQEIINMTEGGFLDVYPRKECALFGLRGISASATGSSHDL